jgi:acyl transferase domain-containing protein
LKRLLAKFQRRHAVLFVIPGGSGGFPSLNVELYRDHRAFRDSVECTAAIARELLGWDPSAAFRGATEAATTPELERRNELVHHGLTRIALIDQWIAEGIVPDGAIGVSLGEVIAPYAAGAISREACARLMTVVAHSITEKPSAHRTYVVEADAERTRRLCRTAPARVDFLGPSSPKLSLVLCSESDAEVIRKWFGDAIVKEAPSGWPYHTPNMHWNVEWSRAALGSGVALRAEHRPIYSSAVGALLPADTQFDAQCIQWMMTGPSHFANAVSAAFADGFDTCVQFAARPMYVLADVMKTAEAEGRRVRQFHAFDAKARATVRAMKRDRVTPRGWTSPPLSAISWTETRTELRDPETERLAERLLQPLVQRKPFDVVSALADPIADVVAVDRDELRRALVSSVLLMLRDTSVRQRVTESPELLHAIAGENPIGVAALRTLLRIAPDFCVFQPLNTVNLMKGEVLQLMIAR